MRIDLPCYGISVELGPPDPDHPGAHLGGSLSSDLSDDPELETRSGAPSSAWSG
jgi:hypothetical protein